MAVAGGHLVFTEFIAFSNGFYWRWLVFTGKNASVERATA